MLGDNGPEVTGSDGEGRIEGTVKPKGKPGRKPGVKLAQPDAASVVSELAKVFAEQAEANRKATIEAIQELKKPTLKEQREEAEEQRKEQRIRETQLRRVQDAKKEEERKKLQASSCSHSFYNPATKVSSHAWGAQVMTPDGQRPYFIPRCTICQFTLKDEKGADLKFPATVHMLTNGVNLDQIPHLDVERLQIWYKQATEQADREVKALASAVA